MSLASCAASSAVFLGASTVINIGIGFVSSIVLARFHFTRARCLYALAGFDLGFVKLRLNLRAEAQHELQLRQTAQSREPIVELDRHP